MRNHRGFTLIELLISIVVLGVVTASLFKLVTTSQRVSRAQTERVTLQSNIRAAAVVLPSELRQINAISGGVTARQDIISAPAPNATTLQFRAMRGLGFVCTAPIAAGTELRIYGPPAAAWTRCSGWGPGRGGACLRPRPFRGKVIKRLLNPVSSRLGVRHNMQPSNIKYEPSPSHKWQTTEAGPPRWNPSKERCPVDLTVKERDELLRDSVSADGQADTPRRWAVRRTREGIEFYESKLTRQEPDGTIVVHGHPTRRVPPGVLRAMRKKGLINQAEYHQLVKDLN